MLINLVCPIGHTYRWDPFYIKVRQARRGQALLCPHPTHGLHNTSFVLRAVSREPGQFQTVKYKDKKTGKLISTSEVVPHFSRAWIKEHFKGVPKNVDTEHDSERKWKKPKFRKKDSGRVTL